MGVQPPPGWLNADQSGVFADNHDVTKAQLLARLGGVVAVSAVLAGLIGVGAGFGAYHFAHDPNDTAFLADLLPALFSLCVGTLIGVCAYVVISMRALKMALPKERVTGSVRFRVLVAPIVVGVAISTINGLFTSVQHRNDYEEAFARWNGPLVLIDGTTTNLPDPSWRLLPVEKPYANTAWTSVNLQWRQHPEHGSETNFVVKMFNTPVQESCSLDECEAIGQSKFGTVYRLRPTSSVLVAVDQGHLELVTYEYQGDVLALINRLQRVSADVFVKTVKR